MSNEIHPELRHIKKQSKYDYFDLKHHILTNASMCYLVLMEGKFLKGSVEVTIVDKVEKAKKTMFDYIDKEKRKWLDNTDLERFDSDFSEVEKLRNEMGCNPKLYMAVKNAVTESFSEMGNNTDSIYFDPSNCALLTRTKG